MAGLDATDVVLRLSQGDLAAADELLPLVYERLRGLAAAYLKRRPAHTLQPTALVHEAFLRLCRQHAGFRGQAHFCAVAATAMRQILTDHARRRHAAKRGGAPARVTLAELAADGASAVEVLALDEVLNRLAVLDARQARLVELRCFAGMKEDEIAEVLGVSLRTVQKDWRRVKAWLTAELALDAPPSR